MYIQSKQITESKQEMFQAIANASASSGNKYNNKRKEREEEKISVPLMRYKLTRLTQAQTLSKLASLTSGFYDVSVSAADWIQRDVRSREFSSFGSIKAPHCVDTVKQIVGSEDYYLKLTMNKHFVDFIKHDSEKNEFHFWGDYQCCIKAMNELRYRICKIESRLTKLAPAVDAPAQKKQRPSPLCMADIADALSEVDRCDDIEPYPCTSPVYNPSSPTYAPTSPTYPPPPTPPSTVVTLSVIEEEPEPASTTAKAVDRTGSSWQDRQWGYGNPNYK